jgi:hypothetical protein
VRPRLVALALLVLAFATTVLAQTPHLTGQVVLWPSQGVIDASLCLTRFTPRRVARLLLANPLNIKVITDSTGRVIPYDGEYGGRIIGEAREYVVRQPDSLPPLATLCVQYRGAVPPFDSATAFTDWKGRIVSMRGDLRAAEQTRWYPTLFDSATGAAEDRVTYDLHVRCATCRAIYVNGSEPVADTAGRFVSSVPRTIMLYAGSFDVHRAPAVTFVNGQADAKTAAVFSDAIGRVGKYYENLLGVPYGEHPVLLSFESVSRVYPNGVVRWQFVTWPTITFSGGLDFDRLLDTTGVAPRVPDWLWGSLSHEMGHYYFGTLRMPHGPLYWFVLESTAEYLALKSTAALRGDVAGATRMIGALNTSTNERYPPLSEITEREQIGATFRYQQAPMRLLALDWQVGEKKVAEMLRALLQSDAGEAADYAAVQRAAARAGINAAQLDEAMSLAPSKMRGPVLDRAEAIVAAKGKVDTSPEVVQLAADLVNADTTAAGRRRVFVALREIVRSDPQNLRAHYQIGMIGAVAGIELDAAKQSLVKYLRATPPVGAPSLGAASYRLGMVLEHRGDVTGAVAAYQRAVTLDSTQTAAREALGRLERK